MTKNHVRNEKTSKMVIRQNKRVSNNRFFFRYSKDLKRFVFCVFVMAQLAENLADDLQCSS